MNCDINNSDKLSIYCDEVKKLGFNIISPDISFSDTEFLVIEHENGNKSISFGLGAIKNVGSEAISNLINEREKNGKFKSLMDFTKRVNPKDINKLQLEGLVKSGAFDKLEINRKGIFSSIPKLIQLNKVYYYPRSKQTKKQLLNIIHKIKPKVTVVSGWVDKDYLYISRELRKQMKTKKNQRKMWVFQDRHNVGPC